MNVTPADIRNQEFKRSFRGYDPADVTAFLEMVANDVEELLKVQQDQADTILELETSLKDYKAMETAIHQTLMQAQETSGRSIENARKEAQLLLQESELKAAQLLDKARSDLTRTKENITIMKAKKDAILSRLKMLLHSELELMKALGVDEELEGGAAQEKPPVSPEQSEIQDIIKSLD
jgi:cell division initiation protein